MQAMHLRSSLVRLADVLLFAMQCEPEKKRETNFV